LFIKIKIIFFTEQPIFLLRQRTRPNARARVRAHSRSLEGTLPITYLNPLHCPVWRGLVATTIPKLKRNISLTGKCCQALVADIRCHGIAIKPSISNAISTKVLKLPGIWTFFEFPLLVRMYEHVKSYKRQQPFFQGTSVTPSGHYPSPPRLWAYSGSRE